MLASLAAWSASPSTDFTDDQWSVAVTLADPKQRYFYFPPRSDVGVPEAGRALVVVLPGGGGGVSLRRQYGGVYLNAMPVDFVMAQLVSVQWQPEQQIVWPTERIRDVEIGFTTSDFIDAVIDDVRQRVRVDPQRIYLMGVSSSGGAVYTAAVTNPDVSGAVVIASVFRANHLPDLAGAAGKRFFLYYGKDDAIVPFGESEAAASALSDHGASVVLYTAPGGHQPSWPNNQFGVLGHAFHWLQGAPNALLQRSFEPSRQVSEPWHGPRSQRR